MQKKKRKDTIWNLPTVLNASRIILALVVIYMIIIGSEISLIVVIFAIAAITDWFDGRIARKYNLVSDFGAKADMVADRFLWVGTALAIVIVFGSRRLLMPIHGLQLLFIMIREIISWPSAVVAVFYGRGFPKTRFIAKTTTFIQGFAIPSLLLSIFYSNWLYPSLTLSISALITGTISAFYYIKDVQEIEEAIVQTKKNKI